MEDVEDKPPPETSVIMAEQKPLVETPEENSEVMMAGTGFPTGDSASTPEATIHGTEETHQEEDIFNRQKEGVSAVTASRDVDNQMNPSTSSSETKELHSGPTELVTDSPQAMVADVAEDNSASTSEGAVHVTEQSNQGAMAANSEAGELEDMSNRQQDGGSEPSTSSFKEKELQNDHKKLKIDVPQTVDTDVFEEAVGSHSVASGNDVDDSLELQNDHKGPKIELPQIDIADVPVEAVEPPAASDQMASSSEQIDNVTDVTDVALRGDDSPSASDDSQIKLLDSPSEKTELQDDQKEQKTDPSTVGATDSASYVRQMTVRRTLIDTAAPFESVKEAVSKFGGIVDWKAHRIQTVERRKHVEHEHEKAQQLIPEYRRKAEAAEKEKMRVLQELDTTKRLIEELKLNLERAQTEERQARQDSELAKLRVEEMEQGIADDSSVAAKAQLEVARARYSSAVTELTSIKEELDALRGEYASLVVEKDEAVKKSEEAIASSKQVEKTVEDLTIELIATKEALESAHAAHMEAEEQRIGTVMAKDQDCLLWEKELKQAEEELHSLNQKILSAKDLKSKLQAASALLLNLKAELSVYMESKPDPEGDDEGVSKEAQEKHEKKTHSEIQEAVASAKKELEEVKLNIEKATTEVNYLKVAVASLKTELENEKLSFASMRQREGMASITAASLEGELENTISETVLVQMKEKEAREKIAVLPKKLQEAVEENNEAKLIAQEAREELQRVEEEAEQLKASASTLQSKLLAAEMEIEAARASERLALAAGKALQESESPKSNKTEVDSSNWVTLSVEEYYNLSKQAHDAEKEANMRVATANSKIEAAKESELRTLEKLNGVTREMAARRESLKMAMDKAEKAREGKLGVEQELRKWRADHEERRKAGSVGKELVKHQGSKSSDGILERHKGSNSFDKNHRLPMPLRYFSSSKSYVHSNGGAVPSPDSKSGKKKKKSFFPWVLMFFGKKKSHTTHSG